MFSLFKRNIHTTASEVTVEKSVPTGFIKPDDAQNLLLTPRRQQLISYIWQRTSVSRDLFQKLYMRPIERYAALVQQFPASESHHHAYLGGMLDHGLEVIAYALKLRQSYLLPIGSSTEEQAAQSEVWTAGIAYGALLHDIGKIAVDIEVETVNQTLWHPWHDQLAAPYRFMYRKDREYRLHGAASGLLYNKIIDQEIMDWLNQYPEVWRSLLYLLAGQVEQAGILGEIVIKADQASVAQELGGDPSKAMVAPKNTLQRKLLDGLRYLIKEELGLNQAEASDGWLTDDALWLVSKTVSDKLRAYLLSQGISGIPNSNTAIFDVLQEHGIIQPTTSGKAIWSATVTSPSGWSNSFTFLKAIPTLIWHNNDQPDIFLGSVVINADNSKKVSVSLVPSTTSSPSIEQLVSTRGEEDSLDALFNLFGRANGLPIEEQITPSPHIVVAEPAIKNRNKPLASANAPVQSSDEFSGEHFMQWLRQSILTHKLVINDTKATVHTVADTIFIVTPSIFMRYAQEFPMVHTIAQKQQMQGWLWIQKQFESLRQHRKTPEGLNIWTCTVTGPRKTRQVSGYLLSEPQNIMPEIPFNNPYLTIAKSNGETLNLN